MNFGSRLDGIFVSFYNHAAQDVADNHLQEGRLFTTAHTEAKQAITALIKELVAEAKPDYMPISKYAASIYSQGFNQAVDDFEQNLLKALETWE